MKTVILVTLLLCTIASASPVWLAADATFQSRYIWRGAVFNDGAVLQPWVAAGIGGAAVTVWGNMDLTDTNTWLDEGEEQDPTGKFTEIDLILNYSEQLGPVGLTAGFNKYWYPNTSYSETAASELTLAAGFSVLMNPTATMALSLEDSEGIYTALGLSHSVGISDLVSAGVSLNLGYGDEKHNTYYYEFAEAGLTDLTIGLSVPVSCPSGLTITPMLEYASLIKPEIIGVESTNVRGGLSLTYYFP